MLYPMLSADFSMIDDHEIVKMLGGDARLSLSKVVTMIPEWAIEYNGRFRPGYYSLRLLESAIAGDSAPFWYANRLALALLSALAIYCGVRVLLQPFYA